MQKEDWSRYGSGGLEEEDRDARMLLERTLIALVILVGLCFAYVSVTWHNIYEGKVIGFKSDYNPEDRGMDEFWFTLENASDVVHQDPWARRVVHEGGYVMVRVRGRLHNPEDFEYGSRNGTNPPWVKPGEIVPPWDDIKIPIDARLRIDLRRIDRHVRVKVVE